MTEAPSAEVLRAFELDGRPEVLAGGPGGAYRVGDVVLKRAGNPDEIDWSAGVLASLPNSAFRVPRYLQGDAGACVVDGWFAQTWLEGAHDFDRWSDVLDVCAAFHEALQGLEAPAFIAQRSHPWAVADRMAWGEETLTYAPPLAELAQPLAERLAAVESANQVIHGDFSGNVLFAEGSPPAVIDFTPYWRPASFARAIVVIDALTWHNADISLIDHLANDAETEQLLLRAELRRLLELDQQERQHVATSTGSLRRIAE